MLVLTRHRGEKIMIGDDIEISIEDIKGNKVRVGIAAPKEIQVYRREVYDEIKRENSVPKIEVTKQGRHYTTIERPLGGAGSSSRSVKEHYSPLGGLVYT